MLSSVIVSTLDRASSRISTRGFRNSARAMATRCFWPPESVRPRSPIDRPVAFREAGDIGTQPGQFRRTGDLRFRGIRDAPGDVLSQSRAEQEGLLRNKADLAADLFGIEIAQIDAVHEHSPGGGIEQPRDEMHQRTLAAARMAHNGHRGAGRSTRRFTAFRAVRPS